MMNPDVKARWVAALRSGKYEQGKDYLKSDNKFCCLGVLCDIQNVVEVTDATDHRITFRFPNHFRVVDKDKEVFESVSLMPDGYEGLSRDVQATLTRMNDNRSSTFDDIANYIEKNL